MRPQVTGSRLQLCHCTEIAVTCRICGPLVCKLDLDRIPTVANLKQYQAFILEVHNSAMHQEKQ